MMKTEGRPQEIIAQMVKANEAAIEENRGQDIAAIDHIFLSWLWQDFVETQGRVAVLRAALETSSQAHRPTCQAISSHPYPDRENCRCWQRVRFDALAIDAGKLEADVIAAATELVPAEREATCALHPAGNLDCQECRVGFRRWNKAEDALRIAVDRLQQSRKEAP